MGADAIATLIRDMDQKQKTPDIVEGLSLM